MKTELSTPTDFTGLDINARFLGEATVNDFKPFNIESHNMLERFFDGPIPEVGDAVELVCYERTPTSVSMKWRVRKP